MRWLMTLAMGVASLAAQTVTMRPPAYSGQPEGERVVLDIHQFLAKHGRLGPAGYVVVAMHNPDARAHVVDLTFRTMYRDGLAQRDRIALEPKQVVTKTYPLTRSEGGMFAHATCGSSLNQVVSLAYSQQDCAVLLVSSQSRALTELTSEVLVADRPIDVRAPRGRSSTSLGDSITTTSPSQLPDRWQGLAGFDAVAVDGRGQLDEARQRVLLDALAAGGALYVFHAASLPRGPLADACAAPAPGFGRLCVRSGAPARDDQDWFAQLLIRGDDCASDRGLSGPVPDWWHAQLTIPGLGQVPLGVFVILIGLFVVLAGPVSFYFCRRIGRPVLMVFMLPLLGFGFAAAILIWGLFAEGLGTVGVRQSLTWLDQRTHTAVTHTTRTLYAGLQPAELVPNPASLVTMLGSARQDRSQLYGVDFATGRLDGSLLPSRTPTQLVTATPQRLRERLRLRRLADGNLEVLAAPEFAPAPPGMVVRDHRGQTYCGEVQGDRVTLTRCTPAEAAEFVREARMEFGALDTGWAAHDFSNAGARNRRGDPRAAYVNWLARHLQELDDGTFLAWTGAHPGVDGLGLDVTWRAERHLVIGRLAEEDFVD